MSDTPSEDAHSWFDTHAHLDRYPARERNALLARAAAAGVVRVLSVATSCASARRGVLLPAGVLRAVGIHPHCAADATCPELEAIAAAPGVVAIGETGFDAVGPPWIVQARRFAEHCARARRLDLTVVLHVDGGWEALLESAAALEGLRVVRLYFTGDAAQAAWHAERSHYLSFGRPLLRDAALQAIAQRYPAHLLLIETDSYPLPGRTTEPRDVVAVGEALARLRGLTVQQCARLLWENSARAFALPW